MIRRNIEKPAIPVPLPPRLNSTSDEPSFKRYKLPKSIDENVKKNTLSKMYDYFYFDEKEHTWKAVD